MAHVRFLRDYPYTPSADRRTCVKYKAGFEGPVRRECADAAIKAGAAELLKTPVRPPE